MNDAFGSRVTGCERPLREQTTQLVIPHTLGAGAGVGAGYTCRGSLQALSKGSSS